MAWRSSQGVSDAWATLFASPIEEGDVKMRKRLGFTLIELLVVVAIIAILAAILFPTFARAKKEAHKVQCIANLHQLFIAVGQYANDYGGDLPRMVLPQEWQNTWPTDEPYLMHEVLKPYIKDDGICSCPAWKASSRF